MTRIVVLGGGGLAAAAMIRLLRENGAEVILANTGGDRLLDDAPPSLDSVLRQLERDKPVEPEFKVSSFDDDRRGDPQRDVAMLRREMLSRERSNRHMLKKGRGR